MTKLIEDACDPLCAINWLLDVSTDIGLEQDAFLRSWREGSFEEWPDYLKWVKEHPPIRQGVA